MEQIPQTKDPLVLRTDFSNSAVWNSICEAIREPVGEFRAYVSFISNPKYDGLSVEEIVLLIPEHSEHTFIFIVDDETIWQAEHPILVVDLYTEPGRIFRVIPSEMWGVENNLSTSNMDFEEFADETDEDGIFRGFPEY